MKNEVLYTSYNNVEVALVHRGCDAIAEVLRGEDEDAKLRLLFCLEYYFDDYYGEKLPDKAEICQLLQQLYLTELSPRVHEGIGDVLVYYRGKLSVLYDAYENLSPELRCKIRRRHILIPKDACQIMEEGQEAICVALQTAQGDTLNGILQSLYSDMQDCFYKDTAMEQFIDSSMNLLYDNPLLREEMIHLAQRRLVWEQDVLTRDLLIDLIETGESLKTKS